MKLQNVKKALTLLLALLTVFCFAACKQNTPTSQSSTLTSSEAASVWDTATHNSDQSFGSGSKTVTVEVIAGEKSVTFTVKTDKENLADTLIEHSLVEGSQDQYGLYIKKVNGIVADYDIDSTYWSLSKSGESLMTGASSTEVKDGDKFEFTRAK